MPFCGLIPPQASCDLFFLDLEFGARVLFVLHLKSVKSQIVVLLICSSLIALKRGTRALFLLGAGFYPGFLQLQDYTVVSSNRDTVTFLTLLLPTLREALHFSSCVFKISHQLSACQALRFAYEKSVQFSQSCTTKPLVHHEISQLHCNKPRSKHRAIMVKSRQI